MVCSTELFVYNEKTAYEMLINDWSSDVCSSDHDAVEGGHLALGAALVQRLQRVEQVAAHGAAETAGIQQDRILVDALDQRVVEADLAELVDDHRHPVHSRVRQQRLQQGGLPTAEEAGQDRKGVL